MSCGVSCRHGSDPVLLWLAARAVIQALAWEPPYAAGATLKKKDKKKNRIYSQSWRPEISIYEDTGLIPGLSQWVKDPALP